MRKLLRTKAALAAGLTILMLPVASAVGKSKTIAFADARLKIEYNATDGDAGLQVFADAEAWREIVISNPAGKTVFEAEAGEVITNYGLTELFSESSEPNFEQFPFEEFKKLFPEGLYTFTGRAIDGTNMQGSYRLSHRVPGAPEILTPEEDSRVEAGSLVVDWNPATSSAGTDIALYQVLVVDEEAGPDGSVRTFEAAVPASVTSMTVPAEFLSPGSYKAEVLAIEAGGNQTLTEHSFTVR